jgi:hypoxanthine phosphoribosyltransferase
MSGANVYYQDLAACGLTSAAANFKVTPVFQKLSSYINRNSTGNVVGIDDVARGAEVAGKHVLIVEDIFDTGGTMTKLIGKLEELDAKSIRSTIAFHKRNPKRVLSYQADYIGFEVPNTFIVGYGTDYNEKFRDVPHLFELNALGIKTFAVEE